MAATRVQKASPGPPSESVEERFRRLETQWSAETRFLSDPGKIMGHPALRAIIAMGDEVVPIILREMQAQIEQVGKNVDACLNAGGAAVKDIFRTVSYTTQPAKFDKYADLRRRYFGPPSPKSAMVSVPQLTSPDFLVQVEAFAAIK